MKLKICALVLFFVIFGSFVYADICTAVMEEFRGDVSLSIDYGNGKIEKIKKISKTDFIIQMESNGWKIDQMGFSANQSLLITEFIFRK
jgi:hypothetical protein